MDICPKCNSTNTFHNFEGFECLDCGEYVLDNEEENEC